MAYKTIAQLLAEINANITTNGVQGITGAILNTTMTDMAGSLSQGPNGGVVTNRVVVFGDTTGRQLIDSGVLISDLATTTSVNALIAAAVNALGGVYQPLNANLTSFAALVFQAGDIFYATGAGTLARLPKGSDGDALTLAAGVPIWQAGGATWPPNTINGLKLSRPSTTTFGIAIGNARNNDGGVSYNMVLAAPFTKSSAAWAVGSGNGGLDTGAVAASTWYYIHMIRKDSDGSIDFLYSLSATAPTMPVGYTARRRIGSIKTDAGSLFILFYQNGKYIYWDAATIDFDVTNPGAAAVSRPINIPPAIAVTAKGSGGVFCGTNNLGAAFTSLNVSDQAPQASATAALTGFSTISDASGGTAHWSFSEEWVESTTGQIRTRLSVSGAADHIGWITRGWLDNLDT